MVGKFLVCRLQMWASAVERSQCCIKFLRKSLPTGEVHHWLSAQTLTQICSTESFLPRTWRSRLPIFCPQAAGRGGGEDEGPDVPAGGARGVHPEDPKGETGAETGNGGQVEGAGWGAKAAGGGPRQPAPRGPGCGGERNQPSVHLGQMRLVLFPSL